jgi:hypothetical protein
MSSIGTVSGDPMVELAVLMLENAERLGELERQKLDDARRAMEWASQAEVTALHDAADAVALGALVQGGLTFVGGAVSCGAVLSGAGATQPTSAGGTEALSPRADATLRAGGGLGTLAEPMSALAGEVPRRHADAQAATARQESERASMDAEDARSQAQREDQQSRAVLDRAGQILETASQGNLAILGNF